MPYGVQLRQLKRLGSKERAASIVTVVCRKSAISNVFSYEVAGEIATGT
jgi:hypothetical protein